jgi:hypothetical protein
MVRPDDRFPRGVFFPTLIRMRNPYSGPTRTRRTRPPAWGRGIAVAAFALWAASGARAEICKYSDLDGNVHYSNLPPEKGWKRLSCTVGDDTTVRRPAGTAGTPTPPGFPRVNPETQRGRDDVRRKVLGEELATEEKLLAEARTAYADGAPVPLPEEKTDAEKYRVRIGKLRQTVNLHEKNVEALKKEIATVK